MKTKALLLWPLLALSLSVSAQQQASDYQVPKDVVLKDAADYARYEKDALGAADWLLQTPLTRDDAKRKAVSTFFYQWVAGAPEVKIEIREYLHPVVTASPALVPIFMAGYTHYLLTTHNNDLVSGNVAAVKSMLAYYKGNNGVDKSPVIDDLVKKDADGTLEAYIKSKL